MRLQQTHQVPRTFARLLAAEPGISRDPLIAANYRAGMLAFQHRCSACYSFGGRRTRSTLKIKC